MRGKKCGKSVRANPSRLSDSSHKKKVRKEAYRNRTWKVLSKIESDKKYRNTFRQGKPHHETLGI